MKIICIGIGSLGSNICDCLVADNRGTYDITLLDFDKVEERNLRGTQQYFSDQVGIPKVEALQYNTYKAHQKEINIINEKLSTNNLSLLDDFNLVIDCLDNEEGRNLIQAYWQRSAKSIEVLHCGFSQNMTFSLEWGFGYEVPKDIPIEKDICEQRGATSFIKFVSALASTTIQDFLRNDNKRSYIGNAYGITEVK